MVAAWDWECPFLSLRPVVATFAGVHPSEGSKVDGRDLVDCLKSTLPQPLITSVFTGVNDKQVS